MSFTADQTDLLPDIVGLRDFWSMRTGRSERLKAGRDPHGKTLMNVLGLGLEQTFRHLSNARPDFETFQAWVLDIAGPPDPLTVSRYNAWRRGQLPPRPVQSWLDSLEAAAPVLDAGDLAHWDREGYVILRAAISPAEAKAAADLLWRHEGATPDDPASWYGERQQGIMVQLFQGGAMQAARRSTRIHKAFAQLWNSPDLWMTIDRMSFSAPVTATHRFRASDLHWDVSLVQPIPFATQAILYLTDTAEDQGALRLVPGFHHRLDAWLQDLPDGVDPRRVDLSGEARPIPAGAGDLIIWRHDLPHGASPNTSDRPRLAQYVNMYPADLKRHEVWR